MVAEYDLPLTAGANCVLIAGKRAGVEQIAACVIRSDRRVDVNGMVRRTLDVRRLSFMPHERATEESQMEFGGITPIGLPPTWRVLLDSRVLDIDVLVLGSGLRRSKLLVRGSQLPKLLAVNAIEGLGIGDAVPETSG